MTVSLSLSPERERAVARIQSGSVLRVSIISPDCIRATFIRLAHPDPPDRPDSSPDTIREHLESVHNFPGLHPGYC